MPPASSRKSACPRLVPIATNSDLSNHKDVTTLVQILPRKLKASLLNHPEKDSLVEIVMDLGRCPEANFGDHREPIGESEVTVEDLEHVVSKAGEFGEDNRAGIEGTLHRVSCIRNRNKSVIGLTLRVGKPVKGPATLLNDILKEGKSVLLLGAPGIGKSTVIRDVARVLSDEMGRRVVIVDTSNEIGGHGNIPHPFIGGARRMQVSNINEQYNVMIEAVQNHRPEVVIVDEVGRLKEADACRSIAARGVQIIATAHGHTMEDLVKNPELVGLIGGIETVTIGDVAAIKKAGASESMKKTVRERKGPSAFEVLVEMQNRNEWIIHDVETSVDQIIRGQGARVQVRSRDSSNGAIQECAMMYMPSSPPEFPEEKGSQEDKSGNNVTRTIQVQHSDHSKYFKASVVVYISKGMEEEEIVRDEESERKLLKGLMKTMRKMMTSLLSNPNQMDEVLVESDSEPKGILLIGGLELWLRCVADVHNLKLSQTQYQCAAQSLAWHALEYIDQRISQLRIKKSHENSTSSSQVAPSDEKVPACNLNSHSLEDKYGFSLSVKAELDRYVSKRIDEEQLTVFVERLAGCSKNAFNKVMRKTKLLLGNPDKIHESVYTRGVVPEPEFIGLIDLWLRDVAEDVCVELTERDFERASLMLAAEALDHVETQVFRLVFDSFEYRVSSQPSIPVESSIQGQGTEFFVPREVTSQPATASKLTKKMVKALHPLLVELIQGRNPKWGTKKIAAAGEKLLDKMTTQLERVFESPWNIGNTNFKFNIRTDVQEQICGQLRKIVAEAGKGVKGINGDDVKIEAVRLTGVANSMLGEL